MIPYIRVLALITILIFSIDEPLSLYFLLWYFFIHFLLQECCTFSIATQSVLRLVLRSVVHLPTRLINLHDYSLSKETPFSLGNILLRSVSLRFILAEECTGQFQLINQCLNFMTDSHDVFPISCISMKVI